MTAKAKTTIILSQTFLWTRRATASVLNFPSISLLVAPPSGALVRFCY